MQLVKTLVARLSDVSGKIGDDTSHKIRIILTMSSENCRESVCECNKRVHCWSKRLDPRRSGSEAGMRYGCCTINTNTRQMPPYISES